MKRYARAVIVWSALAGSAQAREIHGLCSWTESLAERCVDVSERVDPIRSERNVPPTREALVDWIGEARVRTAPDIFDHIAGEDPRALLALTMLHRCLPKPKRRHEQTDRQPTQGMTAGAEDWKDHPLKLQEWSDNCWNHLDKANRRMTEGP